MVSSHDLPTDSVLRRHALTELNRVLGLPPTDSVLRRHYEQLQAAQQTGAGGGQSQAAGSGASSASGDGFLGWLRRLFGA